MTLIRVAAAPCSWGVLELAADGARRAAEKVLGEMASAGYEGTELGDPGFLPTDPEELRRTLAAHGLETMAAFVPVRLADPAAHEEGVARAVSVARLLGAVCDRPLVVLSDENGASRERAACAGRIRPDQSLSQEAWRVFAAGAERVAQAVLEATGSRTVFHHHCAGFVETPDELETLLRLASAELLGLCLDSGHLAFGGGDPLGCLERHRGRIRHLHLKDFDPEVAQRSRRKGWDYLRSVREGIFCELGKGSVPFAAMIGTLRRTGYGGWVVVEQDVLPGMGTPLESAIRSREHLRALGL